MHCVEIALYVQLLQVP